MKKHLLKEAGLPSTRRQDVLHPSEMAKDDWCPRQSNYRILKYPSSNPEHMRPWSFQTSNVFEEGHHIHAKYQRWLGDMGVLWGRWRCLYCGREEVGLSCKCPEHGSMEYQEVPLEAPEYLINGHADGAVPGGLIEIKSVGIGTLRFENPDLLAQYQHTLPSGKKVYDLDGLWKGIRRPFPSHLRQGNIYLRLCMEMGYTDLTDITFIYEFKPTQAVKEFRVKHAPSISGPLFAKALDVKRAVEVQRVVDRPKWATGPDGKVCRSCPFVDICWREDGESIGANGDDNAAPVRRVTRRFGSAARPV